jgi:hypothetical protein
VYVRKRIGRRRSFFQKHRVAIVFFSCAGIFIFAIALASIFRRPIVTAPLKAPVVADAPPLLPKYQPVKNERMVYPYSVIPGGVRSREELAENFVKDPVVASHFADFGISQSKIVRAEETQFMHVSYRMRNKVYWTKKTVKIPKGESLITDGRDTARTRCGNKVSVLPQEPVSDEEPPVETFDIPIIAETPSPELDRITESDLEWRPDTITIPPPALREPKILPYYYRPLFVVNPSTPPDVPEPGTLVLFGSGLAGILALRLARKKK